MRMRMVSLLRNIRRLNNLKTNVPSRAKAAKILMTMHEQTKPTVTRAIVEKPTKFRSILSMRCPVVTLEDLYLRPYYCPAARFHHLASIPMTVSKVDIMNLVACPNLNFSSKNESTIEERSHAQNPVQPALHHIKEEFTEEIPITKQPQKSRQKYKEKEL